MTLRRQGDIAPTIGDLVRDDGDIAVIVTGGGSGILALVRHGHDIVRMPAEVEVSFAPNPAKPQTPIRLKLKAGWTAAQWRRRERE